MKKILFVLVFLLSFSSLNMAKIYQIPKELDQDVRLDYNVYVENKSSNEAKFNLAMSYADIVVLLHGGELVAFGPTNEILVAENLESVFRVKTRIIGLEDRENPLIVIDP